MRWQVHGICSRRLPKIRRSIDPKQERDTLANSGRDFSGAATFHAQREAGAKDAPAIHGEGRQKIEAGERHVDPHQLGQERPAHDLRSFERGRTVEQGQDSEQPPARVRLMTGPAIATTSS